MASKAPGASFLTKTLERSSGRAMTIVSRGALAKMTPQEYGLLPVGTGPFRVTFHQLGQGVVLEKFDNYYDPERPKLDKITIKPIIDAEPLAASTLEPGFIQPRELPMRPFYGSPTASSLPERRVRPSSCPL